MHRGDPAFALVTSALGRGEVTAGLATALLVMIAEDRAPWEPLRPDGPGRLAAGRSPRLRLRRRQSCAGDDSGLRLPRAHQTFLQVPYCYHLL